MNLTCGFCWAEVSVNHIDNHEDWHMSMLDQIAGLTKTVSGVMDYVGIPGK